MNLFLNVYLILFASTNRIRRLTFFYTTKNAISCELFKFVDDLEKNEKKMW